MTYDKIIVSENGEEFPYSESFDENSYYYKASIVLNDRDGELFISKCSFKTLTLIGPLETPLKIK